MSADKPTWIRRSGVPAFRNYSLSSEISNSPILILFLTMNWLFNQDAVSAFRSLMKEFPQLLNRPEQKWAWELKISRYQLWMCQKPQCIIDCFNMPALHPTASIPMNNQAPGEEKCLHVLHWLTTGFFSFLVFSKTRTVSLNSIISAYYSFWFSDLCNSSGHLSSQLLTYASRLCAAWYYDHY